MTDSYIWQRFRERLLGENGNERIKACRGDETKITELSAENVIEPNEARSRDSLCSRHNENGDKIWFEIFPLRAQPFQQELGASGRNRWISGAQININCPKGIGTYDLDSVYDAIAARFRRGDIFDGVRVVQTAYRSSARIADDYYSVPVTVMFQADLEN